MAIKSRIVDVLRKPAKCPVCGGPVVDIVYGTGEMEEWEFLMRYRKIAIMGGDVIPRNPPVWACSAGCRRFRKVNPDGTVADIRVRMLKHVRPDPASVINWESDAAIAAKASGDGDSVRRYSVEITTECGEHETLTITATGRDDAVQTAQGIIAKGVLGLDGLACVSADAFETED